MTPPDQQLTQQLAGRDGIIHYWQQMSGGESPLWSLCNAYGARPTNNPDTVALLIRLSDDPKVYGDQAWVNIERKNILTCK